MREDDIELLAYYYFNKFSTSGAYKSTGFHDKSKKRSLEGQIKDQQLTPLQLSVYRECLPFYQLLRRHAIGNDMLNPGSSISELNVLPNNQFITNIYNLNLKQLFI